MRDSAIVIAGAGQAGFQAAASLREQGFDGRVILVGDEPSLPYQRPPLSKSYLMGKLDRAALRFRPDAFFAENGIERRTGLRIEKIDRAARQVVLQGGEAITYDHLILALGASSARADLTAGLQSLFYHIDSDGFLFGRSSSASRETMSGPASPVAVAGASFCAVCINGSAALASNGSTFGARGSTGLTA